MSLTDSFCPVFARRHGQCAGVSPDLHCLCEAAGIIKQQGNLLLRAADRRSIQSSAPATSHLRARQRQKKGGALSPLMKVHTAHDGGRTIVRFDPKMGKKRATPLRAGMPIAFGRTYMRSHKRAIRIGSLIAYMCD